MRPPVEPPPLHPVRLAVGGLGGLRRGRAACSRAGPRGSSAPTPAPKSAASESARRSRRVRTAVEDDHAREHRRHEGRHRLPEHVAQRQEIQEPERHERPRVLRYFAISRSIGTMFARMLRWVRTTPFGSAVAPDVKIISARRRPVRARSPAIGATGAAAGRGSTIFHTGASDGAEVGHDVADEDRAGVDDGGDAQQEVCRGAVVDRDEDHAAQQASPQRDDPFRTVFAPDDDVLAAGDAARRAGARRRRARRSAVSR